LLVLLMAVILAVGLLGLSAGLLIVLSKAGSDSENKKGPQEAPCAPPVVQDDISHPRRCARLRQR
jgi:hypothetical protein